MAIAERRDWQTVPIIRPPETPAEKPYYITPNRKGLDLTLSPYPRRPDVAAYERFSLDFAVMDPRLSEGIRRIYGPNTLNKVTANLFENIRCPDMATVDLSGLVKLLIESKTSKGERFANEARTKVELLPRFSDRMVDNSAFFMSLLMVWFPQEEVRELIQGRVVFQDPSQTDLVFLTPYPENEEIVEAIGKGEFRSVTHRVVDPSQVAIERAA